MGAQGIQHWNMTLRRKGTSTHFRSNAGRVEKKTINIRDPIRFVSRETPCKNKKVFVAKIRLADEDRREGSTEEAVQQLAPNVVWKLDVEDIDTVRSGSVTNRSFRNSTELASTPPPQSTGKHEPATDGSHNSTPSSPRTCRHVRGHEDNAGDAAPSNTASCNPTGDTNAYLGPSSSLLQHHQSSALDEGPTMAPPMSHRASRGAEASLRASRPGEGIRLYTDIHQYVCEGNVAQQMDNGTDESANDGAGPELVQSNALQLSIPSAPNSVNTRCATAPVANRDPKLSVDHLDEGSRRYSPLARDQEEGDRTRFDRDMPLPHEDVPAREGLLRANEEKCAKLQSGLETERLKIQEAQNALAAKERGLAERENAATIRETNCLQREQHLNGLQAELPREPFTPAVHIGRLEEMLAAQRYDYRVLLDRYTALSYANDQFRAAAERAKAYHTQQLKQSHDHIHKCQAYISQCKTRIALLEHIVHFWEARRGRAGVREPDPPSLAFARGTPRGWVDVRSLGGRRVDRTETGERTASEGNGRSVGRAEGGIASATVIDLVSDEEAGQAGQGVRTW